MEADYTSREGADALRCHILKYWTERGYDVQVFIQEGGFSPQTRASRFDVRSDMVNGLPRAQCCAATAREAASADA